MQIDRDLITALAGPRSTVETATALYADVSPVTQCLHKVASAAVDSVVGDYFFADAIRTRLYRWPSIDTELVMDRVLGDWAAGDSERDIRDILGNEVAVRYALSLLGLRMPGPWSQELSSLPGTVRQGIIHGVRWILASASSRLAAWCDELPEVDSRPSADILAEATEVLVTEVRRLCPE